MKELYGKIVAQTKAYFEKNGFKRAVLGLSGGLDSAICAMILTDILGAKNVYGIFMPSKITSSQSEIDADELAKNLDINYFKVPINNLIDSLNSSTTPLFEQIGAPRAKISYTQDNFQARSRANIIWAVANEFEATIPISTSDKSESYMGYATINGDMSGGFAPIADVLKTELIKIAKWRANIIPKSIATKSPTAELAIDNTTSAPLRAEDALMPYAFMDEVIFRLEESGQNFKTMMNETFEYERNFNLPTEQKRAWLEKFASRVKGAVFKWNLMPEIAPLNPRSLNSKEHLHELEKRFVF